MWKIAPTKAPIAPPTAANTNGFIKRRLTPKIAGSVIPKEAESADGIATVLRLAFFVLSPTARQAPNCAKFAAEAIGIHVFNAPVLSIPNSIVLYMWCRPMTTVIG